MAPRLSGQIVNFLNFFCLSIPKRESNTKKTTQNIEVWPESLGAMLEYWYIMVATGQEIVREKKILQGQGKVREFHFESGKIYIFEKSQGKVKF